MSTHRRTWQRAGGSGGGGVRGPAAGPVRQCGPARPFGLGLDPPDLFLETELQPECAVVQWEAIRAAARREGKTPVLVLADKGSPASCW